MLFSKDIGANLGFSKYNRLAISANKYLHTARFADTSFDDLIIDQAGDGRLIVSKEGKRRWIVLHDWRDHYMPYVNNSVKVICLGNFEHPQFRWNTVTLNSYPIDQYGILPICDHLGILVGGLYDPDDHDLVMENINRCVMDTNIDTVTIACYSDDSKEITNELRKMRDELKSSGLNVLLKFDVSEPMIDLYYRSAPAIVHCGSCARGRLHSMAMDLYAQRHTVYCIHNAELYTPSHISEFVQILKTM